MFYGMFFLGIAFAYLAGSVVSRTTNPRADYQGIVYSTIDLVHVHTDS